MQYTMTKAAQSVFRKVGLSSKNVERAAAAAVGSLLRMFFPGFIQSLFITACGSCGGGGSGNAAAAAAMVNKIICLIKNLILLLNYCRCCGERGGYYTHRDRDREDPNGLTRRRQLPLPLRIAKPPPLLPEFHCHDDDDDDPMLLLRV